MKQLLKKIRLPKDCIVKVRKIKIEEGNLARVVMPGCPYADPIKDYKVLEIWRKG